MGSGTIAYLPCALGTESGQSVLIYLTQGQQPNLPAGFVTEMSVSRCPGVMDVNSTPCYRTSCVRQQQQHRHLHGSGSAVQLDRPGVARRSRLLRAVASGRYYVNVRWTYPTCPWGAGNCGTSLQWAPTGSNF
jgi:hypothetical protein